MISPLATYVNLRADSTEPRNDNIDTITIHCFVGQVTAKRGCDYFADTDGDGVPSDIDANDRSASSNYVVGCDGSIGCCVDEDNRSWCSSNRYNDNRAVTIEVASDTQDPYVVTAEAYNSLIDLVTDICHRHGKRKLFWFGDKEKTLAYTPKSDEMIMTVHRWFAAKACPGDYLYNLHSDIAAEVTTRLNDGNAWSKDGRDWCVENGIIAGYGNGEYGWGDPLTREQMAVMLHRFWTKMNPAH